MIIVKKYALLLILVSLFSQQAHAGTYYYGAGFKSCEMWLSDLYVWKSDTWNNDYSENACEIRGRYGSNMDWVQGFLSAHGWKKDEDDDVVYDYRDFISKYCIENPLDNIHDAAQALVKVK